jgi:hypothetical protein
MQTDWRLCTRGDVDCEIIHNFRDLLAESPNDAGGIYRDCTSRLLPNCPGTSLGISFHDDFDRLIRMVEIRVAIVAGDQGTMQFVPRHAQIAHKMHERWAFAVAAD